MAGNQPLFAVPLVGIGKARRHLRAVTEGERVQASIDGGVAIDFYGMRIDLAARLFLEEMREVVQFVFPRQQWLVGQRRQQHRFRCVVGNYLFRIARLHGVVPAFEQGADLFFADGLALLGAGAGIDAGEQCGKGEQKQGRCFHG